MCGCCLGNETLKTYGIFIFKMPQIIAVINEWYLLLLLAHGIEKRNLGGFGTKVSGPEPSCAEIRKLIKMVI